MSDAVSDSTPTARQEAQPISFPPMATTADNGAVDAVRSPLVSGPAPAPGGTEERGPFPQVPGYKILTRLGGGGMGVVYKACQGGLNRLVALKMIRSGDYADTDHLTRFQVEAEATARLCHPGIVQVYEVGMADGSPYLAMEYCAGGSLADRLRQGPLPAAQAVRLLERMALAVHAAHVGQVIHRDLKPANILLVRDGEGPGEPEGVPKVGDFGLAKRLDVSDGHTEDGALLGTPSYMSPEQARGRIKEVGPATDVYALGVILYECLTGRPPFRAATVMETLAQVIADEPAPVRTLQPSTPRDLETICLKCLHKEPGKRYGSAKELAEDCAAFARGDPIRARPVGHVERAMKWVKRKPSQAALYGVVALAAGALLGLGFWFSVAMADSRGALRAEEARSTAAEQLAETRGFFELLRAVEKRSVMQPAGWTEDNLTDLEKASRMTPAADHPTELRSEAAAALGSIDVRPGRVESVQVLGQPFMIRCLAYDPRGRYLALGQERASGFALCHVALIDLAGKAKPRLLSFTSSALLTSLLKNSQEGVTSLAFSPDGRWLVAGTAYGLLQCWDLSRDRPVHTSRPAHGRERVAMLVFSPDGSTLYSGGKDRQVKRWSFPELKTTASVAMSEPVDGLAVHPTEGWVLCSADWKRRFLSGRDLSGIRPEEVGVGLAHACFAPDGRHVLGGELEVMDLRTAKVVRTLRPYGEDQAHEGVIQSLAFSCDGALILSASNGKQVRLWETASGRLLADIPVDGGQTVAAFHPDGRSLAVGAGKEVRFYQIGGLREQTFAASQFYPIGACALHPDGRRLACLSRSFVPGAGEMSVCSLEPGANRSCEAVYTFANYDPAGLHSQSLSFHPASHALASTQPEALTLLGAAGETRVNVPKDKPGALTFAPSGRLWLTTPREVQGRHLPDGRLASLWSSESVRMVTGASDPLCLAAGMRRVVAGGKNGCVYVLAAGDATLSAWPRVSEASVRCVALNADEGLAAAATDRGELHLLRVPEGKELARKTAHRYPVTAVSFAGNRLLATGSRDRMVRLWDCDGGDLRELMSLPMPGPVRWLGLHADGVRLFVLLERECAVRVWHLDRVRERLMRMGLGEGLEGIERRTLPPPVAAAPAPAPVVERPEGVQGLKAELFADMHLRRCVKVRYDPQINFVLKTGSPDPLVPHDHFSARWSGWLKAPRAGRYKLQLRCDDGARVWLDGKLLFDVHSWLNYTFHVAEVELTGRPQLLRVEYYQASATASIQLEWAPPGSSGMAPIPASAFLHD